MSTTWNTLRRGFSGCRFFAHAGHCGQPQESLAAASPDGVDGGLSQKGHNKTGEEQRTTSSLSDPGYRWNMFMCACIQQVIA